MASREGPALHVKGIIVPGCGNRNGRPAAMAVDHSVERRGGKRTKKPAQAANPLHRDAAEAKKERNAQRATKHAGWK